MKTVEKHNYCIWWMDVEGNEWCKTIFESTPSKAKYEAFLQLKSDGAISEDATFGWFLKYVIRRVHKTA